MAAGTWLALRAVQVQGNLERAQGHLSAIEPDFDGLGAAGPQLEAASAETSVARARTEDPLWRAMEWVPFVGDDLAAVRLTATSVDVATRDVAVPVLEAAQTIDLNSLQRDDGSIDIAPIGEVSPVLDEAEEQAEVAHATIEAVAVDGLLAPVATAVDLVSDQMDGLVSTTASLARAGRLVPPMLGATEPRRYFLAFQNPAESRGTGGLIGSFAIVDVHQGRLSLGQVGSDSDLPPIPAPAADLGTEYQQLYGDLPTDVRNVNLSPHFPYTGQHLVARWEEMTGERLDGVLAVDPVVLGRLLESSGPIELASGETVNGDDLVDLTLRDVYARFDENSRARQAFLAELVAAAFVHIIADVDPLDIVEVLREIDGRMLLFSSHQDEQRELEQTRYSGALPPADGTTRHVVVNNGGASKLDYYLQRKVVYEVGCTEQGRTASTLRVTLRNTAPAEGLPEYVYSQLRALEAQPSTSRLIVSTFVPGPSGLDSVTVDDGAPLRFSSGTQLGYDVRTVTVDVPAGEAVEVLWRLDEPAVPEAPVLLDQPLVTSAEQSIIHGCPGG